MQLYPLFSILAIDVARIRRATMPYLSVSVTAPALLLKSFTKLDELVRACNKVVKIICEVIISILFKDAFNL